MSYGLVLLWKPPDAGRCEFHTVPRRVPEIDGAPAAGPVDFLFDSHIPRSQPLPPGGQLGLAYGERHVPRPRRAVRRHAELHVGTGGRFGVEDEEDGMRPAVKENVASGRFLKGFEAQNGAVERLRRFEIISVDARLQDACDIQAQLIGPSIRASSSP